MSLLRTATKPSVTRYMDPLAFLSDLYANLKTESAKYSYLQYSEDLGLSRSNALHLMLRGKRPLTTKSAEKIAEALELKGPARRYWLRLVEYHCSGDTAEREALMRDLLEIKTKEVTGTDHLMQQLEFFTEWYHSIIYELASTSEFSDDPKQLAAALHPRIRPEQARQSLELLQKLGLMQVEDGALKPKQARITTGDEIASMAVMRYHQTMIDLGKDSLTSVKGELRDISSISFACSPERVPLLKKEISAFRKRLLGLAEADADKDQVYQMNIQLFPVTRKKGSST